MGRLASRAGQFVGFTKTQEAAAHKLALAFSRILGTYIDPYTLKIYPALGYWTHMHQDVQRFTGVFPRPDMPKLNYGFGSWDVTVSQIAKGCRFGVKDTRSFGRMADADFTIFRPQVKNLKRDDSNDWYSGVQLAEMSDSTR